MDRRWVGGVVRSGMMFPMGCGGVFDQRTITVDTIESKTDYGAARGCEKGPKDMVATKTGYEQNACDAVKAAT